MKLRNEARTAAQVAAILFVVAAPLLFTATAFTEGAENAATAADPAALHWAVIAAAISVGLGCLGAAFAVAYVGAAAVAAVAEKPELAGRTLIFVGLAEGIAIYGLIIAIMILGKV
ncbi:MAG: H+transporting two-sector ATPase C subunit [Candidatus Hydrogenedentes bacterium]|nr:H+transporting two-sector ATPase C subunit [Candidatus Hydrogenedentota bacterium]